MNQQVRRYVKGIHVTLSGIFMQAEKVWMALTARWWLINR